MSNLELAGSRSVRARSRRRRGPDVDRTGAGGEGRRRFVAGLVALLIVSAMVVLATHKPVQLKSAATAATLRPGMTFIDPRSGLNWRSVWGIWVVYTGRLAIDTPDERTSLVVTESPSVTYTVKASIPTVAPNAGLVFRYQDPSNYWAILAQVDLARPIHDLIVAGTWDIVRAVGGVTTRVASFGVLACCTNGTNLSVSTQPNGTMLFSREGIVAASLHDTTLARARGAGVVAGTPDEPPIWVSPLSGQTIVVNNFSILKQASQ